MVTLNDEPYIIFPSRLWEEFIDSIEGVRYESHQQSIRVNTVYGQIIEASHVVGNLKHYIKIKD